MDSHALIVLEFTPALVGGRGVAARNSDRSGEARGASRGRIVLTTAGLAVGAGVGTLALAGASNEVMEVVLSFGLVALLYLVTEELLVEAHEVTETPFATATFFLGFLALLLVEMIGVGPGHGG